MKQLPILACSCDVLMILNYYLFMIKKVKILTNQNCQYEENHVDTPCTLLGTEIDISGKMY